MRFFLCFLFFLVTLGAWTQVPVQSEEETARKKAINSIKLNGDAIYADVYQEATTEEAALSEAELRSKQMLQTHVIEIFSKRLKMSKKDVQEIWSVLESRCQNIVVKRGDLFRVFTYVMKNSLSGGSDDSGEEMAMTDKSDKVVEQDIKQENIIEQNTSLEAKLVQSEISQPTQPVQAVSAQPVKAVTSQPAQPVVKQSVQPSQPVQPDVSQPVEPVQAAPVTSPAVTPAPVEASAPAPAPVAEVSVPALCQTMISKGNMNELMRYLTQEKRYQRLMFGNSTSMQYPDKCYVVIIDKSTRNIVSVLDKGQTERMNFITKKMDRYSNYRGGNKYAAIFVQEY